MKSPHHEEIFHQVKVLLRLQLFIPCYQEDGKVKPRVFILSKHWPKYEHFVKFPQW